MEDEVTVRQYLEFLGSAEARDAMSRSRKPILFPRDSSTVDDGGHFQLRSDGSWTVPDWLSLDMPILGISHDDACAYTGWRTARAREQGHSHTFRLPTRAEWTLASGQAGDRRFVFGNDFRPKWVSSWFSRRTPNPEAVNSYPIDESIFGVHDLMGSVSEFLATPLDGTLERHVGGSWGTGNPDSFDIWSDLGLPADRPSNLSGFRLVLEIDDGETSREDE
jgi:formylglycine-generating enzyme required for sulfatase activity